MKKTIIAAFLTLIATQCFAAATMECTAKSLKVRLAPEEGAPMVGGIMNGEKVTFLEKKGRWTKIRYRQDKEGYVFGAYLKEVTDPPQKDQKVEAPKVAPEPTVDAAKPQPKAGEPVGEERSILDNSPSVKPVASSIKNVLPQVVVAASDKKPEPLVLEKPELPKMKTITLAETREKDEAIATLKATNEALLKELQAMKQERVEMAALKREISENIRCVVKEREENEKRTQHAELMQKKAEAEIAEIKSTLQFGGHGRLLTLADNGEKAYFKGVGEVNLAFEGGRTVLRVNESSMAKAELALAGSGPEKYQRNGYAYFVVDSKSLASF